MSKKYPVNLPSDIIKLLSYCPLCELSSRPLQAKLLEVKDEAYLIHLQCSRCQSAIIATIMPQNYGLTSIGLITDLNSDEVVHFIDANRISADDVLNFHQLFEVKS